MREHRAAHRQKSGLEDVERIDFGRIRPAEPEAQRAAPDRCREPRAHRARQAAWNRRCRAIGRPGRKITAAATTGPASGPRPASSTPAVLGCMPPVLMRAAPRRRGVAAGETMAWRGARARAALQILMNAQELLLQRDAPRRRHPATSRAPLRSSRGRSGPENTRRPTRRSASRFGCEKNLDLTRFRRLQDPGGHRAQPVDDDHRPLAQRGLETGGPRGDQHGVGGDERGSAPGRPCSSTVDLGCAARERRGEDRAGRGACHGRDEAQCRALRGEPARPSRQNPSARRPTSPRRLPGSSAMTGASAGRPMAAPRSRAIDDQWDRSRPEDGRRIRPPRPRSS